MTVWQYLNPARLTGPQHSRGVLAVQREIILQNLYNITLGIITLGFAAVMILTTVLHTTQEVFRSGKIGIYIGGYVIFALVVVIRKISYPIRAGFLVVLLQALGAAALLSFGLSGTGITFIFASILLANLLFSQKNALFYDGLAVIVLGLIGWLMLHGQLPVPPVNVQANSGNATQWFVAGLVLLFAAGIITSSVFAILRGLNNALIKSENLTQALEIQQTSLEQRVAERSADLKKRNDQFEIASQIAREIALETNLESVLNTAANLIRDRFGFYHVGIFIQDEKGEYAVLRAATGDAGRHMLEHNHRLKIGEIGLVGYVVSRGEARISRSVQNDAIHYKNPNLPDTRSEMALPLQSSGGTIGALDVQSIVEDAFSQDDVRILQTIADQLAIALEKTRLVEQLEQSVAELEKTDNLATQKAWRTHLRSTRQKFAYRYQNAHIETQAVTSEQAQAAQAEGKPVLSVIPSSDGIEPASSVLAVPIKLRNQVLGVVDIRFATPTVSSDLIALIENTVNRLAVSLENARLIEEIQFRAERERLVGEISTKVRSAANVDSVLRIAIQEIGQSLGVSEVMVQLRKES